MRQMGSVFLLAITGLQWLPSTSWGLDCSNKSDDYTVEIEHGTGTTDKVHLVRETEGSGRGTWVLEDETGFVTISLLAKTMRESPPERRLEMKTSLIRGLNNFKNLLEKSGSNSEGNIARIKTIISNLTKNVGTGTNPVQAPVTDEDLDFILNELTPRYKHRSISSTIVSENPEDLARSKRSGQPSGSKPLTQYKKLEDTIPIGFMNMKFNDLDSSCSLISAHVRNSKGGSAGGRKTSGTANKK